MRKNFLLIIISILIFSCNGKTQNAIEDIADNFSFNQTKSNANEIVIRLYDTTVTQKRSDDIESFKAKKVLKIVNKQQIQSLDKVFENAEKTGYCCCPTAIYSISFLNKKETLDLFYVDTLEFKDKVRIYEQGFQYSYIVEKQKWKDYLEEIEH